jgi:hypothetical protein
MPLWKSSLVKMLGLFKITIKTRYIPSSNLMGGLDFSSQQDTIMMHDLALLRFVNTFMIELDIICKW